MLAGKVAAAFGKVLVFELDGIGAGALQCLDGAADIDGIAEAGIGVDDQRQRHGIADGGDIVGKLGHRDQADIRHAEIGIGDAGAGDIDRLEADILDDPRRQRIGDAGQQNGLAPLQNIAKPPIAGVRHCSILSVFGGFLAQLRRKHDRSFHDRSFRGPAAAQLHFSVTPTSPGMPPGKSTI